MVSIEPQRWILEQLVDSGVKIETVLQRGADPETFEPTINQRRLIAQCRIFFATGVLPFEAALEKSEDCLFVNTTQGIEPLYGTHSHSHHNHSHGHHHRHEHHAEAADPHMWTSVSGAKQMAANMADALSEVYPDQADTFGKRLSQLCARLDSIDSYIGAKLRSERKLSFAIWHPSLSYFARDYGLHQIAVGMESKEMSARQVKDAIDHAKADSVKVFFLQREYDTRQATTINDAIGSRLVTIDPLAYDWEQQIILIADELSRP